jgi:hypothetical protein
MAALATTACESIIGLSDYSEGSPATGGTQGDASVHDATNDAPIVVHDTGTEAATTTDAGRDAGSDARVDAGIDTGVDAGIDTGIDAGIDTGVDAGIDSSTPIDASLPPITGVVSFELPFQFGATYDLASGTWSAVAAPGIVPLCSPGFGVPRNGKLVLGGGGPNGVCDPNTTNGVQVYDIASRTWSAGAPMIYGRNQFMMATLLNGGLIAVGGCTGGCTGANAEGQDFSVVAATAETYDPNSGTWSAIANMTKVRGSTAGITALADGRVLVCGGSDGFATYYADCEIYSPQTNAWAATGSMSTPESSFAEQPPVLLASGKVLVVHTDQAHAPEVFDPSTGTWTATSALGVNRDRGARVVALPDGRALIIGGSIGNAGTCFVANSIEVYNPPSNDWSSHGGTVTTRTSFGAVVLPDGRVLIAGGCSAEDISSCTCTTTESSSEIYDPATQVSTAAAAMPAAESGQYVGQGF